MAEYTPKLNLLKKDPVVDGNDTFNIQTMLNDNWDKIDADKKAQDEAIAAAETNAKAYTDAHEEKAAPHSGHETPEGAQEKAEAAAGAALAAAKQYTDQEVGEVSQALAAHQAENVADADGVHGLKIETGVFSPTLTILNASVTVEYSSQIGVYHKIGSRVFFTAYVKTSSWAHTATNQGVAMRGLPFAIKTSPAQVIALSGYVNRFSKSGYTQIIPTINTVRYASGIIFTCIGSDKVPDGVAEGLQAQNLPSGVNIEVWVSGSYLTN